MSPLTTKGFLRVRQDPTPGRPASDVVAPAVSIRVVASTARVRDWDGFAHQCGSSFRCAYDAAIAWHSLLDPIVRRFDIVLAHNSDLKIGQFALACGLKTKTFLDSIQLLPGYDPYWQSIMAQVLACLGPGAYKYGSEWSMEPPREDLLSTLENVCIKEIYHLTLDVVDFSDWQSWDAYFFAISKNIRRNIERSKVQQSEYIIRRTNSLSLSDIWISMDLRSKMYRRKNIATNRALIFVRSALRRYALRKHSSSSRIAIGRRITAIYNGIDFGQYSYYLEGASIKRNGGAQWRLLFSKMLEAYERTAGVGRFVMGPDDGTNTGTQDWDNLVLSRKQCRVKSFPTSVIRFSYRGGVDSRDRSNGSI